MLSKVSTVDIERLLRFVRLNNSYCFQSRPYFFVHVFVQKNHPFTFLIPFFQFSANNKCCSLIAGSNYFSQNRINSALITLSFHQPAQEFVGFVTLSLTPLLPCVNRRLLSPQSIPVIVWDVGGKLLWRGRLRFSYLIPIKPSTVCLFLINTRSRIQ